MTLMLVLAYIVQCGVVLAWSACHLAINGARRRACHPLPAVAPDSVRCSVSVVLAAKDEQDNLVACAHTILAQRGVELDLTIVDDRSTDDTPQLADQLASRDSRCRVIHNRTLPPGWMGKSHACALGASGAGGEWLLFIDADVRLRPDAIRSAVHYAQQHRLDLFSLWLRDGSVGFWERLLVPLCGAMIVIWYGAVAFRSSSRGRAFANGQFLLILRSVYESVGGHARVRSALIEDIPLARAVAADGYAVGSTVGSELATVRMYRSLREVIRGWRRIYLGVLTTPKILGCMLSLLVGSALPMIVLPLAATMTLHEPDSGWPAAWTILCTVHLAVLAGVSLRFFGLARCRLSFLLLYPASVICVLGILGAALEARLMRRQIRWRNTTYEAEATTSALA